MDWNKIVGNISKAVETAQSLGEKAIGISQKAVTGLNSIRSASEILTEEDSLIGKGDKLVGLVNTTFKESVSIPKANSDNEIENRQDEFLEESEPTPEIVTSLATSTDAVTALALMGSEIAKTIQVCQIEETKRTEINARMEVEVTRINAISKLLSDYLNKTFDERAELFDNYFDVLDNAIARGDSELMAATLGSINSLAAQSPFKNLTDLSAVQQQLGQGDTLWDI